MYMNHNTVRSNNGTYYSINTGLNWVETPDSLEHALTLPDGSTFRLQLNQNVPDHHTVFIKQGASLLPVTTLQDAYNMAVEDEYEEIEDLVD